MTAELLEQLAQQEADTEALESDHQMQHTAVCPVCFMTAELLQQPHTRLTCNPTNSTVFPFFIIAELLEQLAQQ